MSGNIPICGFIFLSQFSTVEVHRYVEPIVRCKYLDPIFRSISFYFTTSVGFRIAAKSRKTATLAVSGNQAFVDNWEPTG